MDDSEEVKQVLEQTGHPQKTFPYYNHCLCVRFIPHYSMNIVDNKYFLAISSLSNREGNGTPLQYACLANPMDGGAWQAAVRGVTQSRPRLK